MIYVAFVSHDDEYELVPLGWSGTAQEAKQLCEQHAKENSDGVIVWNEDDGVHQHSRIAGEFWTGLVVTEYNEKFTHYVRPIDINCLGATQLIESKPKQQPKLLTFCRTIEKEIENGNGTVKSLARLLGMSEPAIQYRLLIARLPAVLRSIIGDSPLITELERRLDMEPEDGRAISFTHARELARVAQHIKADALLVALRVLVRYENNRQTEQPPPDYPMFCALLKELVTT